MTQTINIPDHHGCNLTREQTSWPVFDDRQEYRGHITFIQSTAIPRKVYEQLKLGDRTDIGLFLTPAGQWATTLEYAEHLLVNPNTYGDYRVYRRSPEGWDAEEVEELPVLVGADYF
jgi:hypothetical protein